MKWSGLSILLYSMCTEQIGAASVESLLGIRYSGPITRFQPHSFQDSTPDFSSQGRGSICPQNPSRLELVTGPLPSRSGTQNETTSGVLSVYRPVNSADLPIVVWLHGGAFVTGGSEISWYDGSRLVKDGNVVVVTVTYRLGVFGLLQDDSRTVELATQDIILALEWVQRNSKRLGGDPNNITLFGQSAGGYMVQVLLDLRPDLFRRAIIQSSPADVALTQDQAKNVRKAVKKHLYGVTLHDASVQQLLDAQSAAISEMPGLSLPFAPISRDGLAPGGRNRSETNKDILVAWNQDDGSVFAELRMRDMNVPGPVRAVALRLSKGIVTRIAFEKPALELAARLRERGFKVTTFKHTWVPKGFEYLGASHCVDLPLVWGDNASWKEAPMLGAVPWYEWEQRGREYRQALGQFAANGKVPPAKNGRVIIP